MKATKGDLMFLLAFLCASLIVAKHNYQHYGLKDTDSLANKVNAAENRKAELEEARNCRRLASTIKTPETIIIWYNDHISERWCGLFRPGEITPTRWQEIEPHAYILKHPYTNTAARLPE